MLLFMIMMHVKEIYKIKTVKGTKMVKKREKLYG